MVSSPNGFFFSLDISKTFCSTWLLFPWRRYAELPRVVRVAQTSADTDNRKKVCFSYTVFEEPVVFSFLGAGHFCQWKCKLVTLTDMFHAKVEHETKIASFRSWKYICYWCFLHLHLWTGNYLTVLFDLVMPGLPGFDTLGFMRKVPLQAARVSGYSLNPHT